jgi:hypothetical protein
MHLLPGLRRMNASPYFVNGPQPLYNADRDTPPHIEENNHMTTKTQFTDEEWKGLLGAPTVAALYIAMASPGVVDSMKEALAAARAMAEASKGTAPNELLGAIFSEFKDTDALKQAQPKLDTSNPTQIKSEILEMVRKVGSTLDAKATSDEASAYKQWLYQVAVDAANAAKEGDFLGIGGKQVSDQETAALNEIAGVLHISVS